MEEEKEKDALSLEQNRNKDAIITSSNSNNNNQKEHLIQLRTNMRSNMTQIEDSGVKYFYLFGKKRRRLTLKHSSTLIFIAILIISITILFLGVIVPNFWDLYLSLSVGILSSILSLLTIYYLFEVSTTIPGFISTKRQITYDSYISNPPSLEIEGQKFMLKYCETCCVVRDPRSFHCKLCDKCILRHDHHCDFVANCIGKNNFSHFFFFLLFTDLYCIDVTVSGMCFYSWYMDEQGQHNKSMVYIVIIGIILFFAVISGALLTYFLGYHIYLISTNATTNEDIRNIYDNKVFDQGCKANWVEVFCKKSIDPIEEIDD